MPVPYGPHRKTYYRPRYTATTGVRRLTIGQPGLTWRFDMDPLIRQLGGFRFIFGPQGGPFRVALKDSHLEMAERVNARQALELRRSVNQTGRPQRKERHLENALVHDKNRFATPRGFATGFPAWLDESPARRYWRRIEEGGPNPMASQGRIIGFFWGQGPTSAAASVPSGRFGEMIERFCDVVVERQICGASAWANKPTTFIAERISFQLDLCDQHRRDLMPAFGRYMSGVRLVRRKSANTPLPAVRPAWGANPSSTRSTAWTGSSSPSASSPPRSAVGP
jgi:hypothetical protein